MFSVKGTYFLPSSCAFFNLEHSSMYSKILFVLSKTLVKMAAKNSFGKTPLMEAACNEHREIVELLIANGADIEATTRIGVNVLTTASVKREMKEMIM